MPPTNPSTTNNNKRKSASSASSSKPGSVKVPRKTLDSFFAPRVSVSSGNKKETNVVTLNDEQRMVLNMVVDEGKNVFFTGSAGGCCAVVRCCFG
jgi:ATP-dependent DNA helicase PIF1